MPRGRLAFLCLTIDDAVGGCRASWGLVYVGGCAGLLVDWSLTTDTNSRKLHFLVLQEIFPWRAAYYHHAAAAAAVSSLPSTRELLLLRPLTARWRSNRATKLYK